ncbi:juvenile hormone esterase-like [Pectinophora gossypiella]|uniref:juvenile hormone esterase-like n=1 Tax=Pectinophora gossypiella TaxID=13191 RepID=UPI00214ECFBE|nr:juvenile hormone esterase-like [Pectinophora gossypiella]
MLVLLLFSFVAACVGQVEVTPGPTPVLEPRPTVMIQQGFVVGSEVEDGSLTYYEFNGIPYADSTSGIHRFKAPSPPPLFEEVFIADRKNIKCVRPLGAGYEGTEDCLVADVFTPTIDNTAKLPVMVWIKGREFDQDNAPQLSFKHFVEKDVIIVSLNFRESILGFLCLGTETAPGNAGLKDIIAGLRWVQENIEQFGGDPDNVSIFGHGSGAAAVDLVTLSPMSKDLIHKAIAQSGNAIAPWAVTRDNLEYAIQVAEALGHDVTSAKELSEIFTRTSVAALMAVINELDLTDNSMAFAPCLERESLENVEKFLIKSPYETIVEGDFASIPFITGFVELEGTIRAEEARKYNWLERMENSFVDFLQPDLKFEDEIDQADIADHIKAFYFKGEQVDIDDYYKYHGDTLMIVSAIREAYLRAAASTSTIYLYQFSYKGPLGESFVSGSEEIDQASHSEELAYLFHEIDDSEVSQFDLLVSDILIERWTNFAKTGNPTSDTSQVTWLPFTSDAPNYIHILDSTEARENTVEIELRNPHPEEVLFWNGIYETHFLDAQSKWELTDRNEENVDVVDENGSEEDENGGEGDGSEDGDGDENGGGDDEDDDGEPDSASTAVGYTFSIISLFAIINQFHWSQILS